MLDGLIHHVENTVLLKQMPQEEKISILVVLVDRFEFKVGNHSVLGVNPQLNVADVYTIIP